MKQQKELNALNKAIKKENELLKEANKSENEFIDKVDKETAKDILNPVKKGIIKQYKDEDIEIDTKKMNLLIILHILTNLKILRKEFKIRYSHLQLKYLIFFIYLILGMKQMILIMLLILQEII